MRLVYLALGWCAGIVLAANAGLRLPLFWLAFAVIALLLAWRTRRIEFAACLLLALGALRMASIPPTSALAAYNDMGGMTIEGVVAGEPDRRDDRVQIRLAAETVTRIGMTTPTEGLVLVDALPLTDARYGDRIRATGLLYTPGESDRFSYADYLARSGVYSIMQEASVEVVERGAGSFFGALVDLKAQAAASIRSALPEPQAGLLTGILLGNERGIAPEVSDAFAATGAAHVIAISGFNMAVLSGVISGTLRRLRVRPAPTALISILVLGVYTLFVGANAAVVRAALMSGLVVAGMALRRESYLPASLAFAALVLSALNPLVLWDVSFQLSFFATLGLALFATPFTKAFEAALARWFPARVQRFFGVLLTEPLIVTLAALVFTLPLTMLYFGQFSPIVLLVNVLIVPVQAYILLLGLAATLIAFVLPPLAQILYWLDMIPLAWTIGLVRLFGRLPTAEVFVSPNLIALFFFAVLGAAMIKAVQPRWSLRLRYFAQKRAVLSALALAGVGIVVLTGTLFLSRPDGRLHVWLLDMGGSNAVLVQTPRGAQILVDGGRFPSRLLTALGDRMPFNDRTLEVLVLTQPDEAQFGALPAVLERYTPGVILSSGQPNLGASWAALGEKLSAYTRVNVAAGYSLETDDGVRLQVLNPERTPTLGTPLDEAALVLRLKYGNLSFLLTSDLSREAQAALVESGQDLYAAVLQLPERVDRDFLAAVQPQLIVTQVEEANPDELAKAGEIPIYRTDAGGTIHLSTDGLTLQIVQDEPTS